MVKLDNICVFISQYLRYIKQLARLIWKLNGEAEDTATVYHGSVDECRYC